MERIQLRKDRVDETGNGWWSAMAICRSGRCSVERVGFQFVSHGFGIGTRGRFTIATLPKCMRWVPSVDALIPTLYLKGISTGDFSEASSAILSKGASGLSATNSTQISGGSVSLN